MRVREPSALERFLAELTTQFDRAGMRVDLIFSSTSFERRAVARATHAELAGVAVPFATAEDLLVFKLFAARPRDIEDARGIVLKQGESLDWSDVERSIAEFADVPGREQMPMLLALVRGNDAGRPKPGAA